MKWPWKDGGYSMKTHGGYAVTKHPRAGFDGDLSDVFYIAWWKQTPLGTVDSFADAEGLCVNHAEQPATTLGYGQGRKAK